MLQNFTKEIEDLKASHVKIIDPEMTKYYLQHVGHTRIKKYINSIKKSLYHKNESISFDEFVDIYSFDKKLRSLIFDAVSIFEISMRSQLSYWLTVEHGEFVHNNHRYFSSKRYSTNCIKLGKNFSDEGSLKGTPFSEVCQHMTFSDLSFWFKSINAGCSAAKRNISKVYGLKSCDVMEGWMHRLSDIRNICAHHGILIDSYSYKSRIRLVKSISTNYREYYYLKDEIEISKSNDRFAHDGLYNNIVILMYLMDIIDQGSEWRTKVISLLENYSQKVLRMNRRIGLPEDWSRRKIWNVSL